MDTVVPSGDRPAADLEESQAEATVLRMLLGTQLRRLRGAAAIAAEKAGYEIRASRSKIGRMETGRIGLKLRDIEDLLTLYGVVDEKQRVNVLALARRSPEPEWWTQYNDILPGWFETYLGLESAGAAVMREQLRHLASAAKRPGVRLQVVPFARGGHAGGSGSFSVLRFKERDLPDVDYIEQLTCSVYLDQRSDVEHYLEVIDQLSGEALPPADTITFIEQAASET